MRHFVVLGYLGKKLLESERRQDQGFLEIGFPRLSGTAVLMNASFNVKGEPIVCSPRDAIKCFYDTGVQVLALGSFILRK